jgi:Holliday junction resolvasome RuvABC endonuclease subunit
MGDYVPPVTLGLDMSLVSPGIVVRDDHHAVFTAYFFPLRKCDANVAKTYDVVFNNTPWTFRIQSLAAIVKDSLGEMPRYDRIQDEIMKIAKRHRVARVVLEGYAFNARGAGSHKLYELGGILRYRLWQENITYLIIPPSQVKKEFTGNGRADKSDMHREFRHRGLPDLLTLFTRDGGKRKRGSTDTTSLVKNIMHPVQDIVDAVALTCRTTLAGYKKKEKRA